MVHNGAQYTLTYEVENLNVEVEKYVRIHIHLD